VLDALLRLRQICCDPGLLKTAQAARVKESAQLALLLDKVPELIEEGRRILHFSQFPSMLDLIASALDKACYLLPAAGDHSRQAACTLQPHSSPIRLVADTAIPQHHGLATLSAGREGGSSIG
jgi:hypothetical protein